MKNKLIYASLVLTLLAMIYFNIDQKKAIKEMKLNYDNYKDSTNKKIEFLESEVEYLVDVIVQTDYENAIDIPIDSLNIINE